MPKTVESLKFDTDLFDLQVGRIILDDKDLPVLTRDPDLQDVIRNAYSTGYKLLYLLAPPNMAEPIRLPGTLVDMKTTYVLNLRDLDAGKLVAKAFLNPGYQIRRYAPPPPPAGAAAAAAVPSAALQALAVASGGHSRFNIDKKIPRSGCEGMFHAWLANSCNHSVADEVLVAVDARTAQEVGFVTVKRCAGNQNQVNIGLLAVDAGRQRMGIGSALLSRAALWAMECLGAAADADAPAGDSNSTNSCNGSLTVITQAANLPACQCYEHFGFTVHSSQAVHHIWLPEDLDGAVSRSDRDGIAFCKQHFTGRELAYCSQLLSSGLDSVGHYNIACTTIMQELLATETDEHSSNSNSSSSRRVLIVPSGTAALEMAALLFNLSAGDEVIMPSYTFASTANAFVLRGCVPVFVDVHPETLNMDERRIEQAITPRTKAICCVHYAGVPCAMDEICLLASKYGLKVIEDAAQGFMSTYKGRALGTIGDVGCFSFHYTKNIIAGEGGGICVNHEADARRALVMWEKGTNRYDFMMGKVSKYEWIDIGSSFVASELTCAVLLAQLQAAADINAKRMAHYQQYLAGLGPLAEDKGVFRICHLPADCISNAHIFFLVFHTSQMRQKYQQGLKAKGIAAFTHYVPLHSAPAGRKYGRLGGGVEALEVTDAVHDCVLRLPIWADLTAEQVGYVIQTINDLTNE